MPIQVEAGDRGAPSGRRDLIRERSSTVGGRAAGYARSVSVSAAIILLLTRPSASAAAQQPAPAPAPAPAAAPGEKPIDPALRDALQQYATALESLDADAVKKVQPSIDADGLKRAFREMRALDVDIDNVRLLSSDQTSARVSCRVIQTLTPKAGSRQTSTVTRVLLLRRQEAAWIIQAFER